MALTNKQRAFVEAYLANGFNATRAAMSAGYSEKTARFIGAENLTKPNIVAIIEARIAEMTMSADEALRRLSDMARGNLSDFLTLDIQAIQQHPQSHILKKFKRTTRTFGKDDNETVVETDEIELYDAQSALVQILKEQHLRKGEATDIVDDASLTDDERAARIAEILDRARARRDGQSDSSGGESPQ